MPRILNKVRLSLYNHRTTNIDKFTTESETHFLFKWNDILSYVFEYQTLLEDLF